MTQKDNQQEKREQQARPPQNRGGQRRGYAQALRNHKWRCDVERGCQEDICLLMKNFRDIWVEAQERLVTIVKSSQKVPKLWQHLTAEHAAAFFRPDGSRKIAVGPAVQADSGEQSLMLEVEQLEDNMPLEDLAQVCGLWDEIPDPMPRPDTEKSPTPGR